VTFRVIISTEAAKDVDRLEAWLLDKNPSAAVRVGVVMEEALASLEQMPERGRALTTTMRELNAPFGHGVYVIRYRVMDQQVIVTRIFHGRERR
jgi:plasmid stabilization system protein ParE